ncbi:MAG: GIY-YIG nuclease family protein [Bacteroidales bacterium]|nr:GIY-YIG nuclease family protein [Bacteroidales bacterium]
MAKISNNPSNRGYVYVLSNPSFPAKFLKIGQSHSVTQRRKSLSNTSVPFPFVIELILEVDNYVAVEKVIHSMLSLQRVVQKKEFFAVSMKQALIEFKKVAKANNGILYKMIKGKKTQIIP